MEAKATVWSEARKSQHVPAAKVLLVDEDLRDLEYEFTMLHNQGHSVFACPSFAAAVQLVENERFDFAVLSQGGPRFASRNLLERLQAGGRQTPALVLSDCVGMCTYLEAMDLGAKDYLRKPVQERELAQVIQSAVHNPRDTTC